MKSIRRTLNKKIYGAMRGYLYWHHLVKKLKLKNNVVLFFPDIKHNWNYYALLYLEQLITYTNSSSAIILTVDKRVEIVASLFSSHISYAKTISNKDAQHLLDYCSLGPFDDRFFVISLNKPFGRNADKLIGKNGTSVAEIIALGIYRLPEFTEELLLVYRGNDSVISDFLNVKEFNIYGD